MHAKIATLYMMIAMLVRAVYCQSNTYVPAVETCGRETRLWPERIFDGLATFSKDANAGETWALDSNVLIYDIKYKRGYYYILKIDKTTGIVKFERRRVDPVLGNTLTVETIDTPNGYGYLIEFTDGIAVGLPYSRVVLLFRIYENENERIEKVTVPCALGFDLIMPLDYYPQRPTDTPLYGLYAETGNGYDLQYKFWKLTQTSQTLPPQMTCDLQTPNPTIFSTTWSSLFIRGWIRTFDDHENTPLIIHTSNKILVYKHANAQAEMQIIEFQGTVIKSALVFHDIGEYTYLFIQDQDDAFFMYRMILSHSQWIWPEQHEQIDFRNWDGIDYQKNTLFYNQISHVLMIRPYGVFIPSEYVNCYVCKNNSKPLDNSLRRTWCIEQETTTHVQPTTTTTQQLTTSIPTTTTTTITTQPTITTTQQLTTSIPTTTTTTITTQPTITTTQQLTTSIPTTTTTTITTQPTITTTQQLTTSIPTTITTTITTLPPTTITAYTTATTQPLATETPVVTTAATTQNSTTTAKNITAVNTYIPAIETCGNETKLWPERIFDGSATFVRDANASETWALDTTLYIDDIKYIRGYYYILKNYPESTTITLERRRVDPVLGITLSIEIIDTFADYQGVLIEFTNGIAVGLRRTHTILLFIIHENENERIEKFTAPCASEFYHIMPLDYYPRQSTNVPLYGMYSQATLPFQPVHYKFWKLTQTSQVSQPQITCDLNTSNPIIFSTQFEVRFHRGWIRTFDNHKNTPLIIHSTYSIFIYKDIDTQAEMQSIEVQGKIIESAAVFHDIGEYTYIFIEIYGGTFFMYRMILSHSQWTWPEEYKQINLQNSGNVGIRGHYLFYNYVSHVLLVRPHGIYVPTENVNCYTCDNSSRPLDNTPRRTWCIKQETTTQMQPTTTITQQPFTSIPTTFTTATTAQNSTTTAENTTFTTQPFTTETPVATTATTTQTLATSTESTTATTQEPTTAATTNTTTTESTTATTQEPTTATTSTTIAPELTTATTTHQPTTATVTANQTTTPLTTTKSSNDDTTTPTPHVKYYTGVVFDRTSGTPRYPKMSTSIAILLAILCVSVNKQT
jgi:hypothetical protein